MRHFLVLFLLLLSNSLALGQSISKTPIVDEESKAILRVFVACKYKLVLKDPKDKEIVIFVNQIGNGFFADKHYSDYDFIISASHIFLCDSTIGELKASGILDDYDKNHEEDMSLENIIALKDGKVNDISIYTYDSIPLSDIKILFNTSAPKLLSDPDAALLKGILPEDVVHYHLPLMDDKLFDNIFYNDGIGKDVIARGFMLFSGGWFIRFLNAKIEWVMSDILQINRSLHRGLSGGSLIYKYNEVSYAIGSISRGPTQTDGSFDMAWITITKKSFLERRNKK